MGWGEQGASDKLEPLGAAYKFESRSLLCCDAGQVHFHERPNHKALL